MDKDFTLKPGTLLQGRHLYRIESVLGCGGFGITYLASFEMLVDNIPVSVKVAIKEHFSNDYHERSGDNLTVTTPGTARSREMAANSLKDFIAEAKRLATLPGKHPNIVKVNEVFQTNGTAYYVMEYLHGQSLDSYIKSHGALGSDQLRRLITPVIDAVACLHSHQITHLDVKPANIMLTFNADGSMRPVLIDFGLSKHYDKGGSPTSTINLSAYSAGYSPSEQYGLLPSFSPTADVYALGATMLAAATGRRPFDSSMRPKDEPGASLSQTSLDPGLKSVIERAMMARPADRFADARDMLKAVGLDITSATAANDDTKAIGATKAVETTKVIGPTGYSRKPAYRSMPAIRYILAGVLIVLLVAGAVYLIRNHASSAPVAEQATPMADTLTGQTKDVTEYLPLQPAEAEEATEETTEEPMPLVEIPVEAPVDEPVVTAPVVAAPAAKQPDYVLGGAATYDKASRTITFVKPYRLQLNTLDDDVLDLKPGEKILNVRVEGGYLTGGELSGQNRNSLLSGLYERL